MAAHHPRAVEAIGLRKRFGRSRALDGLDLCVEQGSITGFLGPNGAGKSTTIRILLGMYRRDGGTATVLGGDPLRDAVAIHRRIAYVPGEVNLWPQLTGGECIDALLGLRGVTPHARARTEMIDRFELDPTKRMSSYSKGNRQKVLLVAAFAAHADLLILDEPTSGLDPLMENVFTGCVREAADRGSSVLLSSHILGEVEQLCDAVTIIRSGKTVQTATLAQMRHLSRAHVIAEVTRAPTGLADLTGIHDLDVTPSATASEDDPVTITLTVEQRALSGLMRALSELDVRSLQVSPPSLEEMFLRHYGSDRDHGSVSDEVARSVEH